MTKFSYIAYDWEKWCQLRYPSTKFFATFGFSSNRQKIGLYQGATLQSASIDCRAEYYYQANGGYASKL